MSKNFSMAFALSRSHVPEGQALPRDLQALLSAQNRLLPAWLAISIHVHLVFL